ncbi:MAG: hypothetical protein Ta2A_11900 [Treponemataceae bacterium]|nr:MAG: hypothetical protein Ta2A_11900 [Treponemataceae bacterium]
MAFNMTPRENKNNPFVGSIFEYGIVMEAYSSDHTVKIKMTNGQIVSRCKVMSREWVAPSVAGDKYKRSGRRSLPPKNCRVIVLKPFYSYDNALVLCSDFVYDANYTTDDFSSGKDEQGKSDEDLHITPGGWEISENRKNGVVKIVRDKLEITLQDDGNGGVSLVDQNSNKVELTSNGIKTTDKNSNVIEMGSASVKINGNLEVLQ